MIDNNNKRENNNGDNTKTVKHSDVSESNSARFTIQPSNEKPFDISLMTGNSPEGDEEK